MYPSSVAITITSCLAIIACAAPANSPESPVKLTERGLQKDGNTNAGIGSNYMMERGIFDGKSKGKKKDKKKDKGKDKDEDEDENKKTYYHKRTTAADFCWDYPCESGYDESCRDYSGTLLNLDAVTCNSCVQAMDGSFHCSP